VLQPINLNYFTIKLSTRKQLNGMELKRTFSKLNEKKEKQHTKTKTYEAAASKTVPKWTAIHSYYLYFISYRETNN